MDGIILKCHGSPWSGVSKHAVSRKREMYASRVVLPCWHPIYRVEHVFHVLIVVVSILVVCGSVPPLTAGVPKILKRHFVNSSNQSTGHTCM